MFKCTFPYEKVDNVSGYQTSILVNDNVVGLFANDVSYKELISCLDESDIASIQSVFASSAPASTLDQNVKVELVDDKYFANSKDMPVLAKQLNDNSPSLIASSKIFECYPYSETSFKSLDGNTYDPGVPTFDNIRVFQSNTRSKQKELEKLEDIEDAVKAKMRNSVARINLLLDFSDAGFSLGEDFFSYNK